MVNIVTYKKGNWHIKPLKIIIDGVEMCKLERYKKTNQIKLTGNYYNLRKFTNAISERFNVVLTRDYSNSVNIVLAYYEHRYRIGALEIELDHVSRRTMLFKFIYFYR